MAKKAVAKPVAAKPTPVGKPVAAKPPPVSAPAAVKKAASKPAPVKAQIVKAVKPKPKVAIKVAPPKPVLSTKVAKSAQAKVVKTSTKQAAAKAVKPKQIKMKAAKTPVKTPQPKVITNGKARDMLPPELVALGIEVFGSEHLLDQSVAQTWQNNVTYEGTPLTMRFGAKDMTDIKGTYGLESMEHTLGELQKPRHINMVDIGGNYGIVSIAAYKKYPKQLRAVTVEPVPSTYFMLRWNMWLNEVPALTREEFEGGDKTGVLPLNRGTSKDDDVGLDMCYMPPHSMTSQICDCKNMTNMPAWFSKERTVCKHVGGITIKTLVGLFGTEPIAMMKVDCEGCEVLAIPALKQLLKESPSRVRRLAGELHWPTREIEDVACQFESGKFFVRLCKDAGDMSLSCGPNPRPCERFSTAEDNMARIGAMLDRTR